MASGAITHCCLRWGWRMFFSTSSPIVLSLALPTIAAGRLSPPKTQRPSGVATGPTASQSDQLGFRGAVEIRRGPDLGLYLRVRTAAELHDKCRRVARCRDAGSSASAIRLCSSSHASDTSAFRRMRAFVRKCERASPADKVVEPSALLFAQLDTYFLSDPLPGGDISIVQSPGIGSDIPSNSMT